MVEIEVVDRVDVERDGVRVAFEWIGEGWDGDYNSDHPEDEPLLRFTVYRRVGDELVDVDSGSYCTAVSALTSRDVVIQLALAVLDRVEDHARVGQSIRRIAEELSWLDETDAQRVAKRSLASFLRPGTTIDDQPAA
ncbi:MAG: hypothetical protein QME77_12750 [bacterium]|nr:hypothetical protein [bacterium]